MLWSVLFAVLLATLSKSAAGAAVGVTDPCKQLEASLHQWYLRSEREKGAIHEHISTLRLYASRVRHVTEAGVQLGTSTWALLQGLHDTNAEGEDKVHRAYDINPFRHADEARQIGNCLGIKYDFSLQDILLTEIEETDLLFIDTLHVYAQLRSELRIHAQRVRKYIVMHDTTIDGEFSECVRMQHQRDCNRLAGALGVKVMEVRAGLWPAIQEFLAANLDWHLTHRYANNNGLTILARQSSLHALATLPPFRAGYSATEVREIVEQLKQDLKRLPSSWKYVQLGLFIMMFTRAGRKGWDHILTALDIYPLQLQARLLMSHSICPQWAQFRCDNRLPIQRFTQIINTHNLSEAHLARGAVLVALGEHEKAVPDLRMALEMRPWSRHFVDIVGRAFRHMGYNREAATVFDDAVRKGIWSTSVQRPTSFHCASNDRISLVHRDVSETLAGVRRAVLASEFWSALHTEALNASEHAIFRWPWKEDLHSGRCRFGRLPLLCNEAPRSQAMPDLPRVAYLPKTCLMMENVRHGFQVQLEHARLIRITDSMGQSARDATLEFLSEPQGQLRLLCNIALPLGRSLSAHVPGGAKYGGTDDDLQIGEGECVWLDASIEHRLVLGNSRQAGSADDGALLFSMDVVDPSNGTHCEFEPAPLSTSYWQAVLRRSNVS